MAIDNRKRGDALIPFHTMNIMADEDFSTAGNGIRDAIQAISKQAAALKVATFKKKLVEITCPECGHEFKTSIGLDADALAKTMAYTTKATDELTRLLSFCSGGPDSRPEITGALGVFQMLTDEQIATVESWIEEGKKRQDLIQ